MNRIRTADVASMLRRRIQWGLHLGLVKNGDRLPSLRAASAEFSADQRSVLAAYRQLDAEGLVVMRPRSGIYVAGDRQAPTPVLPSARWMLEMYLQGFARGVPPVSIGTALSAPVNVAPLTAACVECNADQILWLAAQLRNDFGLSTTWIETAAANDDVLAERLRASDFIVTTAFHAKEARALADQYELPVVIATANRDQITQIRSELSRGPVYFVGTDERYAKKLLDASSSARWMANLRPLVLDKLNLQSLPTDGPLFTTKAAAELLGENFPRGATVVDHAFSGETRSEIIAIMLSEYLKANELTSRATTR